MVEFLQAAAEQMCTHSGTETEGRLNCVAVVVGDVNGYLEGLSSTCYPDITFFSCWMRLLCKYTKLKVLYPIPILHTRVTGTTQFEKVVFGLPTSA